MFPYRLFSHSPATGVFRRVSAPGGASDLDRFEKRDGAWKIADRRVVIDWTRASLPGEAWSLEKAFGLHGGRREQDPSHGFLADDPKYDRFI